MPESDPPLNDEHADRDPCVSWNADDPLCERLVERLRYQVGDALSYQSCRGASEREPARGDMAAFAIAHGAALELATGVRFFGAGALIGARSHGPGGAFVWWCYRNLPVFAPVAEFLWSVAYRRSGAVIRAAGWLIGRDLLPRQYRLTRWLLLRLLGVTALCAFLSIYVQMDGLLGDQGILPAAEYMERAEAHAERMERAYERDDQGNGWAQYERYLRIPTLMWLDSSDSTLHLLTIVGIVLAILLILDIAPGPILFGLWLSYLSIITVGGTFLMYQWDILLLESLFVAMWFAPWRRIRPRLQTDREPSRAGLWLIRLLVLKLMLLSGAVKLLANDHTWDDLTALDYHFFTQPIPSFTAYYAHHLPSSVHATSTAIMFFIELCLPVFIVLGLRRLRIVAGLGTVFLMAMIGFTGNYGFFNLLAVALTVSLFDDAFLARFVPRRWRGRLPDRTHRPLSIGRVARTVAWVAAIVIIWMSAMRSCQRVDREYQPSEISSWVLKQTRPFRSVNSYGLFASMTKNRPEIIVEGSRDGITWKSYQFEYKPGDLGDAPPLIGPHMPRLDWQMWFAALRGCQRAPWFQRFLVRLLEGSPSVRSLLRHDPFGEQPPTYIRSSVYMYEFANLGSDDWWQRTRRGPFCPTVRLERGRLVRASPDG